MRRLHAQRGQLLLPLLVILMLMSLLVFSSVAGSTLQWRMQGSAEQRQLLLHQGERQVLGFVKWLHQDMSRWDSSWSPEFAEDFLTEHQLQWDEGSARLQLRLRAVESGAQVRIEVVLERQIDGAISLVRWREL